MTVSDLLKDCRVGAKDSYIVLVTMRDGGDLMSANVSNYTVTNTALLIDAKSE